MTQSIHVELGHLTPTDSSLGVRPDADDGYSEGTDAKGWLQQWDPAGKC